MRSVTCLCSARIEGVDGDALADAYVAHTREVHANLPISERRLQDAFHAVRRTGGWDGERAHLDDVEIVPLRPDMKDAYIAYFDGDAFADNPAWASCYCLSFHLPNLSPGGWEARTAAENRADRAAMIERGEASGVLAMSGGRIVGWCNASPRTSLPVLDSVPEFAVDDPERTGAIVCFVIAPQYRGQGIARKLLDGACDLLRSRGLASVEAYPPKEAPTAAASYHGRLSMYLDAGFEQVRDGDQYVVVRREL
jgi:ribosomal protein S18 acetylase RimI-like enzyme